MTLVASNKGVWEGTYSFISPAGWVSDRYGFRIVLSIFGDPALSCRQESFYTWPDGRTEDRVFDAGYDAAVNQMVWDDGRIAGRLWEMDGTKFNLRFGFGTMPDLECFEMVRMFEVGAKRGAPGCGTAQGNCIKTCLSMNGAPLGPMNAQMEVHSNVHHQGQDAGAGPPSRGVGGHVPVYYAALTNRRSVRLSYRGLISR